MKNIVLLVSASLIISALIMLSYQENFRKLDNDFQAYQSTPILPEYYKKELK